MGRSFAAWAMSISVGRSRVDHECGAPRDGRQSAMRGYRRRARGVRAGRRRCSLVARSLRAPAASRSAVWRTKAGSLRLPRCGTGARYGRVGLDQQPVERRPRGSASSSAPVPEGDHAAERDIVAQVERRPARGRGRCEKECRMARPSGMVARGRRRRRRRPRGRGSRPAARPSRRAPAAPRRPSRCASRGE